MRNLIVTICPNCKKRSDYKPNPAYMHICERCGFECSHKDLIEALDVDAVHEEINDLNEQIKHLKRMFNELPKYDKENDTVIFPAKLEK
jgi:hypothetical protein